MFSNLYGLWAQNIAHFFLCEEGIADRLIIVPRSIPEYDFVSFIPDSRRAGDATVNDKILVCFPSELVGHPHGTCPLYQDQHSHRRLFQSRRSKNGYESGCASAFASGIGN
jgi:hypothetical protein